MFQSGSNSNKIFDLKRWFPEFQVDFRDLQLSNGKQGLKAFIFIFLFATLPISASAEDLKKNEKQTEDFSALSLIFASAEDQEQNEKNLEDFSALSLENLLDTEIVYINVLGTHTHLEDEWMVGYKYMFMEMNGNRTGTERVSKNEVLNTFTVSPLRMSMQMHMLMLMYAPSDELTLVAMAPFIEKEMDHETRTGVRFTTNSSGLGDIELKGIYTFFGEPDSKHRFLFNGGLSLPTGSVNKRDILANPANGQQKLPYPMQLGSGTVDLLPGLTYLGETKNWAWGAEWMGTIRLGTNSEGYALGNQYDFSTWGNWKWTDSVSPFIKMNLKIWKNINGSDPELNPATVPTADPDLRGGEQIDLNLGINIYQSKGKYKGHRFAVEAGAPVYQSLDGPQLETDFLFSAGWTYTW